MNDHRRHEQDEHDRIVAQLEQRCIQLEADRAEAEAWGFKRGFDTAYDECRAVAIDYAASGDIDGLLAWAQGDRQDAVTPTLPGL